VIHQAESSSAYSRCTEQKTVIADTCIQLSQQ